MAELGTNDTISGPLKSMIYGAFLVALAALAIALYHHHGERGKVHIG